MSREVAGSALSAMTYRRRLSGPQMARETVTCTCVPYVWHWSQDVVKGTLDLVLSSSTHTNAVQATAVASKGCWFFLLVRLTRALFCTAEIQYTAVVYGFGYDLR